MKLFKLPAKITISFLLASLIAIFAAFPDISFPFLCLERTKVAEGELWRLFTSNFVHFGWAHALMNLAALLLCEYALLQGFSARRFISLFTFCGLGVGVGIYYLNPEYETYAGLSGAIHGFIVAGLLLNKRHAYWVNGALITLLFGKIFYEHQANYQATELQNLLPVPVAYDAHLYGAVAGVAFGIGALIFDWWSKQSTQKN